MRYLLMTKFLKTLKILLFIGAGLLLGNYLILSVFTLFDAIQWIIGGFFLPITNIVYLLKTNHQYSLGLLFAVICILSTIVIVISEKQNKNGVGLSKEERQAKILKSIKIILFIVGGLFLIYSFFDTILLIANDIFFAIEISLYSMESLSYISSYIDFEDTLFTLIQNSPISFIGILCIILAFFTGIRKKKTTAQPVETKAQAE